MASGNLLVFFSPLAAELPASIPAAFDVRNNHPVLDFNDTTDQEAIFTAVLPQHYGGGGLTVHIRWAFTSATSGTASIQAAIETMGSGAVNIGTDDFAAFQAALVTANATNGLLALSTITFTSGAQMDSLGAGTMFRFKVRRDADGTVGTDDATGDAELVGIEIRET